MNNEQTGDTIRLPPLPSIPTEYLKGLDDDAIWYKRENSARAILRIILIGVFVFMFAALVITLTVLGVISLIISSGLQWYTSLAPFALLAVIGYLLGKRKKME